VYRNDETNTLNPEASSVFGSLMVNGVLCARGSRSVT